MFVCDAGLDTARSCHPRGRMFRRSRRAMKGELKMTGNDLGRCLSLTSLCVNQQPREVHVHSRGASESKRLDDARVHGTERSG